MTIPYEEIKNHYEKLTPLIMEASKKHPRNWVAPYCNAVDWMLLFSPIEKYAWQVIRGFGQIPLYPQYPVERCFIDFANPFLKIGVECDGKEFHTDKEKDFRRDMKLEEVGWTIYRISGRDCNNPVKNYYYDLYKFSPRIQANILGEYYHETIEGLIKALAIKYCEYDSVYINSVCNEIIIANSCLNTRRS